MSVSQSVSRLIIRLTRPLDHSLQIWGKPNTLKVARLHCSYIFIQVAVEFLRSWLTYVCLRAASAISLLIMKECRRLSGFLLILWEPEDSQRELALLQCWPNVAGRQCPYFCTSYDIS